MGLVVATKAFFKLLFDRELSDRYQDLVAGKLEVKTPPKVSAAPSQPAPAPKPARSEAITLLAALQREARFVDLVSESLGDYSDQQIGAAAREVLEESGKVIDRMFGLQPLTDAADGSEMATPESFEPAEYRLTGNVSGVPPFRGTVAHHGWKATRCDVPKWNGADSTRMIVAPVEIEVN